MTQSGINGGSCGSSRTRRKQRAALGSARREEATASDVGVGEIYNVEKFVENVNAVVKVATDPADVTADKPATLRIPNRPTAAFISEQIEPIYRSTRNVKLVSFFPSLNMKIRGLQKTELDQCFCLGMFGTLELQSDIHDVADQMLERLRTITDNSGGHFIAIDLRLDMLQQKGCEGAHGTKKCFSALEVGNFLQKIGFNSETVIYVTQSRWHEDLDELKTLFPRTYTKVEHLSASRTSLLLHVTKWSGSFASVLEFRGFGTFFRESVISIEKKDEFLNLENSELEKVIDFYICTHSDVFVPAIPGLFYANVAGQRIASGRTQILVPTRNPTSGASDFLSHYISDKSHLAYSCLC
ncbi:protein MANNAN SYNTHESIS-RELATED 2-like [Nymphaea colorata]|uniref:protein MANNAN SYNTHESIS-RELATED 2-like n=1 Tax=Nymphaea colorata TaxID=210225 RepID=UPI00214E8E98|nr:protein MANNAN SYNTHESIS-RELATED 2-like [Nymphaea colorata]